MGMRLVTRSDFDGLVCGALLLEAGIIDSWKFAHPKDLQDGLVEITENDCLANVPFVPGCGLWFDHHSSEFERQELEGKYKGDIYKLLEEGMDDDSTVYQWRRKYVRKNQNNLVPTLTDNMGEGGHNVPLIKTPY